MLARMPTAWRFPRTVTHRPPRPGAAGARAAVIAVVAACLAACLAACGLADGERFGRPGGRAGTLRVHLLEDAATVDPARVKGPVERGLAAELFAALVELDPVPGTAAARPVPGLALRWQQEGDRLVLHLRDDARFTNGDGLTAHEVLWSWRRAVRPSTGAADLRPLEIIRGGAALARRSLLRVGAEGARGRAAPYAAFLDDPGRAPQTVVSTSAIFPPGTAVRVLDTNSRAPCCGDPVPLRFDTAEGAPAVGALDVDEVGIVIGLREVQGVVFLQLRAPHGSAGWARADELDVRIPAIGLVHVVDRGGTVTLRAGPDEDSIPRATLADEDVVEVLERGPTTSRVIHLASGKTGWLANADLDDTVRERRWYLVESTASPDEAAPDAPADTPADPPSDAPSDAPPDAPPGRARSARAARQVGWLPEEDLAFDPGLLEATALDDVTLAIRLATDPSGAPPDGDAALRALAEPLLRPVPPRVVEAHGHEWTRPENIATSGPFHLVERRPGARLTLMRSPGSALREHAGVERVELIVLKNRTSALHLYRAGLVDAILDGALPPDLGPTLSRASDHVAGPAGGGFVAPEVQGFSAAPGELSALRVRDVKVTR